MEFYHRKFVLITILLGLSLYTEAQDVTNQSNLYIPTSLSIYVDGNIINNGFIQNKGAITLAGDWNNRQVYQGNGKITLDGNSDQHLFNNKQAIQHLVMQSNSNKIIQDKVVITQQLDLLQGVVYVDDPDTLFLVDKAVITVGSLSSYIDGALTTEGSGYKFFPIGKNGKYHPVEYIDVKGISPVIEVEMFENLPPVNAPHASNLYNNVYWTRKDIKGSFTSSPLSFGYKFDNTITKSHVIVAEGDDLYKDFSVIDKVTITEGASLDKLTTNQDLTGKILVLGESDPGYGNNIPAKAFYISTSLSPNAGNSENHAVKIFGDNLSDDDFHFEVYNRWGLQVYTSNSLEMMRAEGWDGRQQSNGNILPSGAYPYLLKGKDVNGKTFEKQGIISIIN